LNDTPYQFLLIFLLFWFLMTAV